MSPLPVFAGIFAFLAYLLAMPALWVHSWPLALLAIVTIGGYLALGLGYHRHELFHNYYRPFSKQLYNAISMLVLSDPQVFRIAHPLHHGAVHTYEDIEFFCQDYATDRFGRRWQFFMELLFGNAAWELNTWMRVRHDEKYDHRQGLLSFIFRVIFVSAMVFVSTRFTPGGAKPFLICYALTLWWGAIVSRHNQWLEHAGIVSDGSFDERNMLTRNLPNSGLLNRLWNFYHHNDPEEHVMHHIKAGIHGRVNPAGLPEGAVVTSVREYPGILWAYWKSL